MDSNHRSPVKDQLVETVLFDFPAEARKRTIGGRRSQPRDLGGDLRRDYNLRDDNDRLGWGRRQAQKRRLSRRGTGSSNLAPSRKESGANLAPSKGAICRFLPTRTQSTTRRWRWFAEPGLLRIVVEFGEHVVAVHELWARVRINLNTTRAPVFLRWFLTRRALRSSPGSRQRLSSSFVPLSSADLSE